MLGTAGRIGRGLLCQNENVRCSLSAVRLKNPRAGDCYETGPHRVGMDEKTVCGFVPTPHTVITPTRLCRTRRKVQLPKINHRHADVEVNIHPKPILALGQFSFSDAGLFLSEQIAHDNRRQYVGPGG